MCSVKSLTVTSCIGYLVENLGYIPVCKILNITNLADRRLAEPDGEISKLLQGDCAENRVQAVVHCTHQFQLAIDCISSL